MIYFKKITKKYNDNIILNNFNLKIEKNDKVVIKGGSGKGKSTLFNLLMGFVLPDEGEIFFNGELVQYNNIIEIRKQISWLPQNLDILGRDSIRQRIYQIFDYSHNDGISINDECLYQELDKLNLNSSILEQNFSEISGGEKQRIGIMICKLLNRPIMILDEPTSALDEANINLVIRYLCDSNERTIFSASHDERWVNICKRIIEI